MKDLRTFLYMCAFILLPACTGQIKENSQVDTVCISQTISEMQADDVIAGINLTVAEGKRLIAKGIVYHPKVKERLTKGIVIITSGTTNTYIAEELAGLDAPHGSLMTGNVIPHGREDIAKGLTRVPNIILIDGVKTDMNFEEALEKMQPGDIVFKGANLLNYEKKQAAVCIGSAVGGTTAHIRKAENAHLIVPIGLEKETFGDLREYEKLLEGNTDRTTSVPRLWVHTNAEIFTEIEAIKAVASVNVVPFAAGGIAGREGGISLAVYGKKEEVQKVLDLVASVQGEPPFVK